jgi:hypothetical protein
MNPRNRNLWYRKYHEDGGKLLTEAELRAAWAKVDNETKKVSRATHVTDLFI